MLGSAVGPRDVGHHGPVPEGQLVREYFATATTRDRPGGTDRWL